jgi:hypothetical protein
MLCQEVDRGLELTKFSAMLCLRVLILVTGWNALK